MYRYVLFGLEGKISFSKVATKIILIPNAFADYGLTSTSMESFSSPLELNA
jgi:hypothetical protein